MKKTFNINLGGIVFHIDEDAYELLDQYLSNLRIHFSKEEGAEEIVHDMELRISELFSERLNERNQVITLSDVEEIIAQMGKPEEFSEDTTQDTNSYNKKEEKGTKRLYRDPDNKVIGWIIIPEASTATEKLSMKGMKVNVENIGKTVTDGFEKVNDYVKSDKPRSIVHKLGEGIVSVVGFLVKAVLVVAAICCTPILFVLLVVFMSLFLAATGVITSLPAIFYNGMPDIDWSVVHTSPFPTTMLSISAFLVIGIPIIGFIHFLMSTLGGWKPMPFGTRSTLVVLWLFALGVGIFFFINFGVTGF